MANVLYGKSRSIQAKQIDKSTGKVDFLSSFVRINNKKDIGLMGYLFVDESTVGRLDIVVNHYYGSTQLLDLFLKFNGIDDMFAVPIGTRLLIPEQYALENAVEYVSTDTKYSLDNGKKKNSFSKQNKGNWSATPTESVINSRSKLQNRGNGFTVVAPGVLKF